MVLLSGTHIPKIRYQRLVNFKTLEEVYDWLLKHIKEIVDGRFVQLR